MDRAVNNKTNGKVTNPPMKGRQQNRQKAHKHCDMNIQT